MKRTARYVIILVGETTQPAPPDPPDPPTAVLWEYFDGTDVEYFDATAAEFF